MRRRLFEKPHTPDENRDARIQEARAHVNKLFGVRGTGRKDFAAPAPAVALSEASGPFAGASSRAASMAQGIRRLLWRT